MSIKCYINKQFFSEKFEFETQLINIIIFLFKPSVYYL